MNTLLARFVGADFVVCIVICDKTNFIVCNFVCIAGKKQETRECYCAFILAHLRQAAKLTS